MKKKSVRVTELNYMHKIKTSYLANQLSVYVDLEEISLEISIPLC